MTASSENDGATPVPLTKASEHTLEPPVWSPPDEAAGTTPETPAGQTRTKPAHAADPSDGQSLGSLVADVTESISTIVRGEIELAKVELRSSVKNVGVGIGFFVGAAAIGIFSLVFGFIALAEGVIALGLSRWAGYLVVFGFMIVLIALLGFMGFRKVKKVKAPERTIATSKDTIAYLKANTGSSKRP